MHLVLPQPHPLAKTIGPVTGVVTDHRLSFGYWDCYDSWNPTGDAQRLSACAAWVHSSSGLPVRPSTEIGAAAPAQESALR